MAEIVTAAILVIGDEILSGRTKDKNIGFIAEYLTNIGIDLKEVRVVADDEDDIIAALNALRKRYDYVFTTGGIGPTHDDITSPCIAEAFGVPWEPHAEARRRLEKAYPQGQFNVARQRMAVLPRGAELIDNPISTAPGFMIGNVYALAGVPRIMQAMFETLAPRLRGGSPVASRAVHVTGIAEGLLAEGLAEIQRAFEDIDIGSYPYYRASGNGVAVVARGTETQRLEDAMLDVRSLMLSLGGSPGPGEPVPVDATP